MIFRKRAGSTTNPEPALQPPPKVAHEEIMTGQWPSIFFPKGAPAAPKAQQQQPVQQNTTQQQAPAVQQANTANQTVSMSAGSGTQQQAMATPVEKKADEAKPAVQQASASVLEEPLADDENSSAAKKVTRSGRENIKAAAGHTCVYHPWRPAYAACAYCHRTFCYADIIKHSGNFYCLEDISQVSSKETVQKVRSGNNGVAEVAGFIFLVNMAIMAYYDYPSIIPLFNALQATNIPYFIISLTPASQYFFPIVDTLALVLLFTGALGIFGGGRRGYYWAVISTIAVLVIAGYGYIYSNLSFLFFVSGISILNLGVLAYSRLSSVVRVAEEETLPSDIAWPMTESF